MLLRDDRRVFKEVAWYTRGPLSLAAAVQVKKRARIIILHTCIPFVKTLEGARDPTTEKKFNSLSDPLILNKSQWMEGWMDGWPAPQVLIKLRMEVVGGGGCLYSRGGGWSQGPSLLVKHLPQIFKATQPIVFPFESFSMLFLSSPLCFATKQPQYKVPGAE